MNLLQEMNDCHKLLISKINERQKRIGEIFDILKNKPESLKDPKIENQKVDT